MALRGCILVVASALTLAPRPSLAVERLPTNAKAQAIFEAARKLDEAGDFKTACSMYERALVLEPNAVGGRLHLARCFERLDKLASAATQYEVAEHAATSGGQPERASYAHKQLQSLAPRLAMLTVEVPRAVRETAADLRITRDGQPLLETAWDTSSPVDAGRHEVRAVAAGRVPWSSTVDAKNGESIRVEIPSLALRPSVVWPWVTGGVGVLMGAAAGVFAYDQSVTQANVRSHCNPTSCDRDEGFDPSSANARLDRDFGLTLGLGIGGGLAIGAGIIGLVMSSESSAPVGPLTSARLTPWFGPGGAGLGARLEFE